MSHPFQKAGETCEADSARPEESVEQAKLVRQTLPAPRILLASRLFGLNQKLVLFFITEWRETCLYYASLSPQEKHIIKKNRLRYGVSLCISLSLHIVLFTSVLRGLKPINLSQEIDIKGEEVNFELTEGMVSSDVNPIYDSEGQVIIKPSLLVKPKDKQALLLNNLLETLKAGKKPALSSSIIKTPSQNRPRLKQTEKSLMDQLQVENFKIPSSQATKSAGFWNQVRMLKSDTATNEINNTKLMKVIDQHSFSFRDCYEKALLKDENLSVRATFLLKLNKSKVQNTKIELKGKGNLASRQTLSHCLFQQSKTLVFNKNQQSLSLRFNLIFGL